MQRARVWLADDSPVVLAGTRDVLASRHDVMTFACGEAVLEHVAEGAQLPDLLVLDWTMPGISGLDVCRFLREEHDALALPILLLSARDSDADVEACFAAGANDHVAKPSSGAELLARAGTLLRLRAQARALRERDAHVVVSLSMIGQLEEERGALSVRARTSEGELAVVLDSIPLLVSFVDADARYRLVNQAYERWFGVSCAALRGQKVRDVIGETAWEELGPLVERGLAGERFDFQRNDVPYRLGGLRDVRGSFIPHRTGAHIDGYVAVLEDVTARRRLEREREAAQAQVAEVLDTMSDAFFAVDGAWRIVLVNRNFERMLAVPREGLLDRFLWGVPELDASLTFASELRRCMVEGVPCAFVEKASKGGRWFDIRGVPTSAGGLSVVFRDVTAEKLVEIEARKRIELEQQLIGIVSHDLRNPLDVISLSTALLAQKYDLPDDARRTVSRIEGAATRSTRLVADLLDFTQGRFTGGIRVDLRPAALHDIVRTVVDDLEAVFPRRAIVVGEDLGLHGNWDEARLAQVVQNLATNAVKYSPPDSVVRIETFRDGDAAALRVHNGGAPIPAGKLSVLFEPFQRASDTGRLARSVGLGLYIARQIVDAHLGSITVASSEQAGTTFTVRLPAA